MKSKDPVATKTKKLEKKLEKILNELESNAESENYHSLISMYGHIAECVKRHGGLEVTVKVMQDILNANGYMN